jgi:hypothetical protein
MFYIDDKNTIHYENTANDNSTGTGFLPDTGTSSKDVRNSVPGKYSKLSFLLLITFIAISIGICYAIGKFKKNICLGFLCFIPCMIILAFIWFYFLKNI